MTASCGREYGFREALGDGAAQASVMCRGIEWVDEVSRET